MNIYLSGGYYHAREIEEVAVRLREMGHYITSTWHHTTKQGLRTAAQQNMLELEQCDVFVQFTECAGYNSMVELGAAMALKVAIVIVGNSDTWQKSIFYELADVRVVSKEALFEVIEEWSGR